MTERTLPLELGMYVTGRSWGVLFRFSVI